MADTATPNFGKSIQQITILTFDSASNQVQPMVYYKKKSGKKGRGSKILKPLEQLIRQDSEARKAAIDSYLEGHSRSNARKRDGWLRDMGQNVFRAGKAWRKKLKEAMEEDED